jgi:hypothetical protein
MEAIDVAKFASRAIASPSRALEPWRDPHIWEADKLCGGAVSSTTRMTLFDHLTGPVPYDYIVADIERGKRWLASRLFIFAILLKEFCGLRFVVIVESDAVVRKLLGITTPDEVRSALAKRYPWFEEQLLKAANAAGLKMFSSSMSLDQVKEVLDVFIDGLQAYPQPGNHVEWSEISTTGLWERSPWLTSQRVTLDLSGTFFNPRESIIQRTVVNLDFRLYLEIMRRPGPCVAITDAEGQFVDLFPKHAILHRFLDQINFAMDVPSMETPVQIGGDIIMGNKTSGDTISGGNIGAFISGGTATIGSINQTINGLLGKDETKSVGTALKALSAAIESEAGIDGTRKDTLLELLEEISTRAAEPKEKMKKSVLKTVVDSFSALCGGVSGLAAAWQTWGPVVKGFFGL